MKEQIQISLLPGISSFFQISPLNHQLLILDDNGKGTYKVHNPIKDCHSL